MSALLVIVAPILAQAQDTESSGSPLAFLVPIVILGGLFYVLILMPQRRRQKQTKELQSSIAVGDEIRTIGGILGKIVEEDESTFTIQLDGSRMRITKRAVAERIGDDVE